MTYAPQGKECSNSGQQQSPKAIAQTVTDERESTSLTSSLQMMMANSPQQQKLNATAQMMVNNPAQLRLNITAQAFANKPKPNNTGLPDNLKTGIESLSGMSMDHVKVHYNSDKPAQLQAHAYAQGSEIHVAPGQERHLPHEAWHVVQQAQGRVKPTMQMKGEVEVNDDAGLEHEADVMGAKALSDNQNITPAQCVGVLAASLSPLSAQTIQAKSEVEWTTQDFHFNKPASYTMDHEGYANIPLKNRAKRKSIVLPKADKACVGKKMVAKLDKDKALLGSPANSDMQKELYSTLLLWYKPGKKGFVRGHLLNHDLGGPAVEPNLFPITGHANGLHESHVETPIKKIFFQKDLKHAIYTVDVNYAGGTKMTSDGENAPNADASFNCTFEYSLKKDAENLKKLSWQIDSKPELRDSPLNSVGTAYKQSGTGETGEATPNDGNKKLIKALNLMSGDVEVPKGWRGSSEDKPSIEEIETWMDSNRDAVDPTKYKIST